MGIAQKAAKSADGFFLTIITPAGTTTKKVPVDQLIIGRAPDCGMSIPNLSVSRRHISITLHQGVCFAEDHGSSNGSFINGKKMEAHVRIPLSATDIISLGTMDIQFSFAPERPTPVEVDAQNSTDATVTPIENAPVNLDATTIIPKTYKVGDDEVLDFSGTELVNSATVSMSDRTQIAKLTAVHSLPREEAVRQSEQILHEAQKKATELLRNAEIEAEKKAADIYAKAHSMQAKVDEFYLLRMNEAYHSSEQLFQKTHAESQQILEGSRRSAGEIRNQAESFVSELRRKTEVDCEQLLAEAQQTARDLKANRLIEVEEILQKREQEFTERTSQLSAEKWAQHQKQWVIEQGELRHKLDEELNARKTQFEADIVKRKNQFEIDHKDQVDNLARLMQENLDVQARLTSLQEQKEILESSTKEKKSELGSNVELLNKAQRSLKQLESEIIKAQDAQNTLQKQGQDYENILSNFQIEIKQAQDKLETTATEAEEQTLRLRSQFEETKAKIASDEQSHFEELRHSTTRQIRNLEMALVDELKEKRERVVREITLIVESMVSEVNGLKPDLSTLPSRIDNSLKAQVEFIEKDSNEKEKRPSYAALKTRQKWSLGLVGVTAGILLGLVGPSVYRQLKSEYSPMNHQVELAQESRKKDLEKRKFNPPQTQDYKDSYVANVIYTENFVSTYMSDEFQHQFLKQLAPYMLKTFKVDEDKVIQAIAMSTSLVKTLSERRSEIHPDFVPQTIKKMEESESEAVTRIKDLLGSLVRYESFQKFEKKFYTEYSKANQIYKR